MLLAVVISMNIDSPANSGIPIPPLGGLPDDTVTVDVPTKIDPEFAVDAFSKNPLFALTSILSP